MKLLFGLLLFCVLSIHVFGQEIKHVHSKHYALTENKGQWPKQVLFKSKSQGFNIWIQQHGFLYDLRDFSNLRETHAGKSNATPNETFKGVLAGVEFLGSNHVQNLETTKETGYYYNFFIGNDSQKWTSNVKNYSEVNLKIFTKELTLK